MNSFATSLGVAFSAGALGGLANGLIVWLFGDLGITTSLGVNIAPPLAKAMLYQRMVWGGIWGLIFLLPILKRNILARGFILGLAPTLVQLLVIFPFRAGKGYGGLELGALTPAFVIFFNAVWGWVAAIWMRMSGR